MKILHVLTAPRAEGTPRLVLDWLSVSGYTQEIVFLSPEGSLKEAFEDTGVWQFYNIDFPLKLSNSFKIVSLLRRTCNSRKPDIVICWPLGFSQWVTIGARWGGTRHILAHNGNTASETFIGRYFFTYLTFFLGRLFGNKIVACSEFVRELYLKIPLISPKHIVRVYNAIQMKKFIPRGVSRADRKDISMVAYLEEMRDHRCLLKAWQRVEQDLPGVTLNIIGQGSLKPELELLSKDLALKNVCFTGAVIDVQEYLWKTNVYVFSTLKEGFGTTLLEALAAGCKVVATDVPACREVLQQGKYGMLVPKNDPVALAQAIIACYHRPITDEEYKEQLNYVEQFSPEKMIRNYLAIFNLSEKS